MRIGALYTIIAAAVCVTVGSGPAAAESKTRDAWKHDFLRPTSVPFPEANPYTPEKAELGQRLFFDPRLSGSNWISCASCHNPSFSWSDGLKRAIGHDMKVLGRRTPTILNTGWAELLMWDGRKVSLEDQALGPISTPAEMHQDLGTLVPKLSQIDQYVVAFNLAFPGEGISLPNIAKAIATYERTVVSGVAPFDRWVAGDESAISEEAKRGFDLFTGKANCVACHSSWSFTDNSFRDIGLPDPDLGRGANLKIPSMQHAFKTPTLRDIERRAPYMHDGSLATLSEVIDEYDRGGIARESLSDEIHPLHLSAPEKADLVAFLRTLNGDNPPVRLPTLYTNQQTAQR